MPGDLPTIVTADADLAAHATGKGRAWRRRLALDEHGRVRGRQSHLCPRQCRRGDGEGYHSRVKFFEEAGPCGEIRRVSDSLPEFDAST